MKRALIVLDAQRIYTDKKSEMYCRDASKTVSNINALIDRMNQHGELIVFVRHMHMQDGSNLGRLFDYSGEPEESFNFKEGTIEVEYDANVVRPKRSREIIKDRYSAFQRTDLDSLLRNAKIEKVVVCGFMTNFCCESTAREALDRDYYVDFVVDATGTPGTEEYKQREIRTIVANLLGAGFAKIVTTKKFLSDRG